MKVLWTVLALSLGLVSFAMANDRENRAPQATPTESQPTRLKQLPPLDETSVDKIRNPEAIADNHPAAKLLDARKRGGSDNEKVVAPTAPVPVKSLGIEPASGPKAREAETRKIRISKIGVAATPAANARKKRSEEVLRAANIPINLNLPAIPDVGQTTERTHREVVGRTLAILATAVKGEGLDQTFVDALVDDFGVRGLLSPEEGAFIAQHDPRMIDRVQFAWRYEAAWAMLWALSAVDELGPPREIVDVRIIGGIVRGETVDTMMEKTTLRPFEEILDEADLIYRYRWALVDARIHDEDPPAGLDPGVALERHRALNWLIGYLGQDWDNVTPDT